MFLVQTHFVIGVHHACLPHSFHSSLKRFTQTLFVHVHVGFDVGRTVHVQCACDDPRRRVGQDPEVKWSCVLIEISSGRGMALACDLGPCAGCGSSSPPRVCSACRSIAFCNEQCQRAAWSACVRHPFKITCELRYQLLGLFCLFKCIETEDELSEYHGSVMKGVPRDSLHSELFIVPLWLQYVLLPRV